jgi:hemerythrin-like domain-containing protein
MLNDFTGLQEVHEQLDELFLNHQIALVRFDLEKAVELLSRFQAEIRKHIRYEEEVLLPIYGKRGGDDLEGGRVDFYLREHQKILALLDELTSDLRELALSDNDESARLVLEFLEKEHPLKTLIDHHDRREHAFLYPYLDKVTTPEEKQAMLREGGASS